MCCILEFTAKTNLNYEGFIILIGLYQGKVLGMGPRITRISVSQGLLAIKLLLLIVFCTKWLL